MQLLEGEPARLPIVALHTPSGGAFLCALLDRLRLPSHQDHKRHRDDGAGQQGDEEWISDFLLLAPATADRPGGLVHMLELKRRGAELGKAQEDLAAWCAEQGVPFACYDDLRDAIAILSQWGALRVGIAR